MKNKATTAITLQARAKDAAQRFSDLSRKPIVLEFAGVPKAGKSSTITHVQTFLRRCGFRVEVVIERASICPIRDKKDATFNVWTACTTLAQILEHTQNPPRPEDPDILILDRGLFDSICWLTIMEKLARLRNRDRVRLEEFLRIEEWRRRLSAVIVMTVSPKEALRRDRGYLPVDNVEGSIMNEPVLQQILDTTNETVELLKNDFRIFHLDTSSGETDNNLVRTAEVVAEYVVALIEAELHEEVLFLNRSVIKETFGSNLYISPEAAESLEKTFITSGGFRPRAEVEADQSLVQALPVVVVRNKSGDILRLKRRERVIDNPLHEKLVIWAGGHVRREDAVHPNFVRQAALRELEEELRLSVEESELTPVGAVFADAGDRSSRHVALVYEWRAQTDDVAVALSNAEFFEKRGTSVSGTFITISQLAADIEADPKAEAWSDIIVREVLAKDVYRFAERLF